MDYICSFFHSLIQPQFIRVSPLSTYCASFWGDRETKREQSHLLILVFWYDIQTENKYTKEIIAFQDK